MCSFQVEHGENPYPDNRAISAVCSLRSSIKVSFGFFNVERVGYVGCGETFNKEENMAMKEAVRGLPFASHDDCLDSSESLSVGRVFEVV